MIKRWKLKSLSYFLLLTPVVVVLTTLSVILGYKLALVIIELLAKLNWHSIGVFAFDVFVVLVFMVLASVDSKGF